MARISSIRLMIGLVSSSSCFQRSTRVSRRSPSFSSVVSSEPSIRWSSALMRAISSDFSFSVAMCRASVRSGYQTSPCFSRSSLERSAYSACW
jgi:hypothetical protein